MADIPSAHGILVKKTQNEAGAVILDLFSGFLNSFQALEVRKCTVVYESGMYEVPGSCSGLSSNFLESGREYKVKVFSGV